MDSEVWIPHYNLYRCERIVRTCGAVGLYDKNVLITSDLLNSLNDVVGVLVVKT